jgi:hypothetical protein
METVGEIFTEAEQNAPQTKEKGMELDTIELSIGINAEGNVGFWGIGQAKVSGVTQVNLTFKRKSQE